MAEEQFRPRPRTRRSNTTLPRFHHSHKDATFSPVESKKHHKNRHSLHQHHFPGHHAKRLAEGLTPWSTNTSNADFSDRRPGRSPDGAPTELQRGSTRSRSPGQSQLGQEEQLLQQEEQNVAPVRPIDIRAERRQEQLRQQELQDRLASLTELSLASTRRLDDICYSIIDKTNALRDTVAGLQELADLTENFHTGYHKEVTELQTKLDEKVEDFSEFKEKRTSIERLEARIQKNKKKAAALSERLDEARRRVKASEALEAEYQVQVSRRFTIFWSMLGGFSVFVIFLLIFSHSRAGAKVEEEIGHAVHRIVEQAEPLIARVHLNTSFTRTIAPALEELKASRATISTKMEIPRPSSVAAGGDDRLRLLDEL